MGGKEGLHGREGGSGREEGTGRERGREGVSALLHIKPKLLSPHTISDKKQWKRLAARLADFLQNIQ